MGGVRKSSMLAEVSQIQKSIQVDAITAGAISTTPGRHIGCISPKNFILS